MSNRANLVDVELYVCAETDKAICFKTEPNKPGQRDKKQVWLPVSQIETTPFRKDGDNVITTVTMPEWLAVEKGLV